MQWNYALWPSMKIPGSVSGKCAAHWNMIQKHHKGPLQPRKYHPKVSNPNELCTCCIYTNQLAIGFVKIRYLHKWGWDFFWREWAVIFKPTAKGTAAMCCFLIFESSLVISYMRWKLKILQTVSRPLRLRMKKNARPINRKFWGLMTSIEKPLKKKM